MITIYWCDHEGDAQESTFTLDIYAIRFEESLDAEGLPHSRA